MDQALQEQLFQINREFYAHHADSFSATRGRVQPGVQALLPAILRSHSVLDVGCGNGTLSRALASAGFAGRYLGVDLSFGLLASAQALLGTPQSGSYDFKIADLAEPDWDQSFSVDSLDCLVSFATLHHLPGAETQNRTAHAFARLIAPDGQVAVSVWQWQNSPRLRQRVVPWDKVGIDPLEVDEGDVLLDWRANEQVGLRYVHTFTAESLQALAESAGFKVVKSFYSDGHSGNLALYQVWHLNENRQ